MEEEFSLIERRKKRERNSKEEIGRGEREKENLEGFYPEQLK